MTEKKGRGWREGRKEEEGGGGGGRRGRRRREEEVGGGGGRKGRRGRREEGGTVSTWISVCEVVTSADSARFVCFSSMSVRR